MSNQTKFNVTRRRAVEMLGAMALAPAAIAAEVGGRHIRDDARPRDAMTGRVALYSAVDEVLTCYAVDVEAATLTRQSMATLPTKVQYAWPHPSRPILYVSTTSNRGPKGKSDANLVSALSIHHDGSLHQLGEPASLDRRATHMCVDPTGRFALNAQNLLKGGMTVHRLDTDGNVGTQVQQDAGLDFGIYPHQVMVFPSGRTALLVDRGIDAHAGTPEKPGALRSFDLKDGVLSTRQVVAPGGGYGFGPRHVVFHPSKPWLYVSDERTNRLHKFDFKDDRLQDEPTQTLYTLKTPHNVKPRQFAGAIHVHPNGRFLYVANRGDYTVDSGGVRVFGGGENNIAVFAIDPTTGNLTLIQHADTHSFHVRTFACDPDGRLLVTASVRGLGVKVEGRHETVPAALSVFRIGNDGRLQFERKYDVETGGGQLQYWMGMVGIQ